MWRLLMIVSTILLLSIQTVHAVRCWQCNSNINPLCSKWNPKPFVSIDCERPSPHLVPSLLDAGVAIDSNGYLVNRNTSHCRKVIQTVNGQIQIQRGCGYLNESDPNVATRVQSGECTSQGRYPITMTYCNCYSDECNAAYGRHSATIWFVLMITFTTLLYTRFNLN